MITGDPIASAIQVLTADLENALLAVEGNLGSFLGGVVQNLTESIEAGLTSGGGNFFDSILQDLAGAVTQGPFTGIGSLIESIIAGFTCSAGCSASSSGSRLADLFSNIIGNITVGLDTGLSKAEGSVAQGITNALGIEQFYAIHLQKVCAGTLSDASDPHARFIISACFSYAEAASGEF